VARERIARIAVAGTLLALGAALLLLLVRELQTPPEGPEPVAWDRVRCARCGMLVGQPGFAAQIHTHAGEVLNFDDPGCLLLHELESAGEARAVWFHHVREERWISGLTAGFVGADSTPMGYGLGAVDASSAELTYDEAREHALAREAARTRRSP
jgi:copper chaperone NosL